MADKRVTVTIEAIDNASATLRSIGEQIEALAGSGTGGKIAGAVKGVTALYKEFDKLQKLSGRPTYAKGLEQIGSVSKMALSGVTSVASGMIGLIESVTGADLSLQGIITSATNYEQVMKQVGAITDTLTGKNKYLFDELKATADELGASTIFTQEQIAEGMQWMAQNGMKAEAIIKSMADVANLATIGNMDLADSANIVSSALNQFHLNAGEATRVVDTLNAVALTSGATVEKFGKTLEYVGPIAGGMGISIEEVGVAVGLLGKNAITGSKAGTVLRNVLTRLTGTNKNATQAIKDYGLEAAVSQIKAGNLTEGLAMMSDKFQKLSADEQNQLAYMIAGQYGMAGLIAMLSLGGDAIRAYKEELEDQNSASETAAAYMDTLAGQMNKFVANAIRLGVALKDSLSTPLKNIIQEFNDLTDALLSGGIDGAMQHLATRSVEWGKAIEKGITDAISNIKKFVTGGGLDNLLQAGTNIIQGICRGITENEADIRTTMTTFVGKLAGFIEENAPAISDAVGVLLGCFRDAIDANSSEIDGAANQVMNLLNTSLTGQQDLIMTAGRIIGPAFVEGFLAGVGQSAITMAGNAVSAIVTGIGTCFADMVSAGMELAGKLVEGFAEALGMGGLIDTVKGAWDGFWGFFEQFETENSPKSLGEQSGRDVTDNTAKTMNEGKAKTDKSAEDIGNGIKDNIMNKLAEMDASALEEFNNEVKKVGDQITQTAETAGQGFTNMANSARTNFVAVTNICRNQMVNLSNIIRNQIQNARNAFTSQMLSMAAVARTQMVNISNIVRNQAVAWSNIIRNQAQNARNALTSSFMSMAAVARTQMAKVLSVVQSYMAQIAAACNKSFTINVSVNKTINTTIKAPTLETSLANVAVPVTSSLAGTRATAGESIGLGTLIGGVTAAASKGQVVNIEVPLYLEGREIARASAKYMDGELSRVNTRSDRKRGVK